MSDLITGVWCEHGKRPCIPCDRSWTERFRALEAHVAELEDALGTNRMCANCTGGIHGLCAGILRCNCGCEASRNYYKASRRVEEPGALHKFDAQGGCIVHRTCGVTFGVAPHRGFFGSPKEDQ